MCSVSTNGERASLANLKLALCWRAFSLSKALIGCLNLGDS